MKFIIRKYISKLLPRIEIHIWGGLGSQLYALTLGMRTVFQKRRVVFVFHNSGVTKRNREAQELFDSFFQSKEIDDFDTHLSEAEVQKTISHNIESRLNFRKIISMLFRKIRIISNGDSEFEIRRIKPWTLQLRGHYSSLEQHEQILLTVWTKFYELYGNDVVKTDLAVHYRLDDLILHKESSVISKERLSKLLVRFQSNEVITIYSDSIELAQDRLQNLESLRLKFDSAPTYIVILNSVNAKTFIGTTSKVSYWVVFLRIALGRGSDTYMPQESISRIYEAFPGLSDDNCPRFY